MRTLSYGSITEDQICETNLVDLSALISIVDPTSVSPPPQLRSWEIAILLKEGIDVQDFVLEGNNFNELSVLQNEKYHFRLSHESFAFLYGFFVERESILMINSKNYLMEAGRYLLSDCPPDFSLKARTNMFQAALSGIKDVELLQFRGLPVEVHSTSFEQANDWLSFLAIYRAKIAGDSWILYKEARTTFSSIPGDKKMSDGWTRLSDGTLDKYAYADAQATKDLSKEFESVMKCEPASAASGGFVPEHRFYEHLELANTREAVERYNQLLAVLRQDLQGDALKGALAELKLDVVSHVHLDAPHVTMQYEFFDTLFAYDKRAVRGLRLVVTHHTPDPDQAADFRELDQYLKTLPDRPVR